MILPFPVENSIIQAFAQEMTDAKPCNMQLMVNSKASEQKVLKNQMLSANGKMKP